MIFGRLKTRHRYVWEWPVPFTLQIATSSAAGALITLIGVFGGAILSGRYQRRHWRQDKQIDACANLVVESRKAEDSLQRLWVNDEPIEWGPWNQALAAIWLVGHPAVVELAAQMDETFWRHSLLYRKGQVKDGRREWPAARDLLERDRLAFINSARVHVMQNMSRLTETPGRRPPASEFPGSPVGEPGN